MVNIEAGINNINFNQIDVEIDSIMNDIKSALGTENYTLGESPVGDTGLNQLLQDSVVLGKGN